jgi:phage shock protein A
MSDTVSGFKHNLFGGFRQSDVINCVKRIAQQRNEYKDQYQNLAEQIAMLEQRSDEMQERIAALEQENAQLKLSLENSKVSFESYKSGISGKLTKAISQLDEARSLAEQSAKKFSAKAENICLCLHKCTQTLKSMGAELGSNNKN